MLHEERDMTAFEVLEILSTAYSGKQVYFIQDNGLVYGRYESKYMTLNEAVDSFERYIIKDEE